MHAVDLNCDLGEGAAHDEVLMPLITSANVACGAHAGDDATMRAIVRLAKGCGVALGAHPGYEDRENFGRKELELSPTALADLVRTQVLRLRGIAAEEGVTLRHVKPHGALYNRAARDEAVARVIAAAVREIDPALILVGLANSALIRAGESAGLRTASEAFADRAYLPGGSLVPRSRSDAALGDEDAMIAQVLRLITGGEVQTVEGATVKVRADTICLHGDGPHALAFAKRVRRELENAGVAVRAI